MSERVYHHAMRMRVAVPVLACFLLAGCLDFSQPLGPVGESFIESGLVGAWGCVSADEPEPASLTIRDFDGKQYLFELVDGDGKTERMRAHATRIGERAFLNVIAMGEDGEDPEWWYLEYTLAETGPSFRHVDPRPFAKDMRDDPALVRELLAGHLDDPEFFIDAFACTKAPSAKPADGPG